MGAAQSRAADSQVADSKAAETCLRNSVIIQRILKHLFPDSMKTFTLRLLNKSFNSEILHRIKISHRKIEMNYRKTHRLWLWGTANEPDEIKKVYINDRSLEADDIFDYIRFLKEVVNVRIEKLVIYNFWRVPCGKWRKKFHDEIHKLLEGQTLRKFIGMSDLCPGFCTKCQMCAGNSLEYGPLQIGINMDSFGNRRHFHFEKLIVDEQYLHGTVSNTLMYMRAEGNEKFKKCYVDPLISCDQLCFKINEVLLKRNERPRSQPLPLEVIEEMCDVWEVKSIGLEFNFWPQSAKREETWPDKGIFTPIRLDELYQETRDTDKKKRKFSSVTIDMRYTKHIYSELTNGLIGENVSYSNLIANVGQVFPTDKIIIISTCLPFLLARRSIYTRDWFENILKSVWKNPGRMEVTITDYPEIVREEDDFEFVDSINIMDHQLKCTLLPDKLTYLKNFSGRRFRITDEVGEKTLNLGVFVRTNWNVIARNTKNNNETPHKKWVFEYFFWNMNSKY